MHDAHGGMDQAVFDCFGAWRELANSQIQIAVNHTLVGRPVIASGRTLMEEIPDARGKPEHRKQANVCEPLA